MIPGFSGTPHLKSLRSPPPPEHPQSANPRATPQKPTPETRASAPSSPPPTHTSLRRGTGTGTALGLWTTTAQSEPSPKAPPAWHIPRCHKVHRAVSGRRAEPEGLAFSAHSAPGLGRLIADFGAGGRPRTAGLTLPGGGSPVVGGRGAGNVAEWRTGRRSPSRLPGREPGPCGGHVCPAPTPSLNGGAMALRASRGGVAITFSRALDSRSGGMGPVTSVSGSMGSPVEGRSWKAHVVERQDARPHTHTHTHARNPASEQALVEIQAEYCPPFHRVGRCCCTRSLGPLFLLRVCLCMPRLQTQGLAAGLRLLHRSSADMYCGHDGRQKQVECCRG